VEPGGSEFLPAYYYFDKEGDLIGMLAYGSFCCEGLKSGHLEVGQVEGVCTEPREPLCGCGDKESESGAAGLWLLALGCRLRRFRSD
jgi:hypothetical protein